MPPCEFCGSLAALIRVHFAPEDFGATVRDVFVFIRVHSRSVFVVFAPLADVAKGGDGAKSAFHGNSPWLSASICGLNCNRGQPRRLVRHSSGSEGRRRKAWQRCVHSRSILLVLSLIRQELLIHTKIHPDFRRL
jgi:hypothetical protein